MKTRLLAALAVTTTGLLCAAIGPASAWPTSAATAGAVPAIPAATPTPASTLLPVPDPTGTPTFSSNFTGKTINTSIWATCYNWANPRTGCTNFGNPGEDEWYLPSQVQQSGGVLHLVARHEATAGQTAAGKPEEYQCRSGMVTTLPGFSFEYGVVQVVATVPSTAGLWSAFWLVASDGIWPPEIDMLERWGPPYPQVGQSFHPDDYATVSGYPTTGNLASGYHTVTLQWTPTSLTWWIDGTETLTTSSDIPAQQMYFIADLANYSLQLPGSCSGSLLVKSVKIWQTPAAAPRRNN